MENGILPDLSTCFLQKDGENQDYTLLNCLFNQTIIIESHSEMNQIKITRQLHSQRRVTTMEQKQNSIVSDSGVLQNYYFAKKCMYHCILINYSNIKSKTSISSSWFFDQVVRSLDSKRTRNHMWYIFIQNYLQRGEKVEFTKQIMMK